MRWDKSEFVVRSDRWDKQEWDNALFDMQQVQKNRDELWDKYNFVNHCFEDLFMDLYQGLPIHETQKDMQEDHILNHHVVSHFSDLQEVAELRVSTKYDTYAAAFSMVSLQPTIKKLYEDNEKLMELMKQIQELLGKLAMTNDPGEAGELEGQIQGLVDQANGEMSTMKISTLKDAVKKASKELSSEESLMRTFGLEEGQLSRMDFAERRSLAEKLRSGKFLKFAHLVGQFKLVAKGAKRSKVSTVPDEVAGLELGQDIGNLSIEALIELCTPELELKFLNSYVNHELVQRHMVGPHALGRGPIIVVCDESGSMGAACFGGTREMWSKALSLALCDQARRNKRDFYYIGFSSGTETYDVKFPKGRIDHKKLVEFVEHFFGGGTYPFPALMQAAKIVESYKQNRPDIVFITDGEYGEEPGGYYAKDDSNFYEEWNRIKTATSMQCFGVSLDCEPREMSKVADTVLALDSMMANPEKMSNVMKAIEL